MLLTDKTAIVYGAGGSIGGAVARAFAAEGARLHLVGRTRETLEAVAAGIKDAEVAVVDALDERAVEEHLARVGDVDVSFNLVTRGDVQGAPLTEMPVDDFLRPVTDGLRANFLTARAAGRRMAERGSGVILTLNSGSAHGSPMMGGTGPADAAIDTLVRNLAIELGPRGVRAVGMWAAGVPETFSVEKLSAVNPAIDAAAVQGIVEGLAQMRMTRRNPTLAEVAATAVFLASDHAAGLTGTFVNVTGGMVAR
ncbi:MULTISPECIES: SDR family oxidoreductase [unclassified Streptomyces]|jgi:NAD(P)-dependent dehydrogenase (short-subunit alcohol dehydrogenase family)|uniref:SDR family NAD(P)-dependent oxidoreductase n=1 Tax=unclassified Streptomyces TaxID=2593676 RepID=UPI00114F7143|nr:SDR family oxidoreductase [Streptomyces sp. SLBN-31]TQJ88190.1 NADP-dependent 3-hydroxy acid dehydrogenase YdfG [Streptomyces sp. SLBN-31]